MRKIRCPACQARLKLPESFQAATVRCPKCDRPFSATVDREPDAMLSPTDEPLNLATDETVVSNDMTHQSDAEFRQPPHTPPEATSNTRDRPTQPGVGTAPLQPRDFGFRRFWTPAILRFSWRVVVILATCWLVFLSIAMLGNGLGGEQTSLLDSFGMPDFSSLSSLDLEQVMDGRADVQGLNDFLDDLTHAGQRSRSPSRTPFQSLMAFGFSSLSFITLVMSLLLSVLFCRVCFETLFVLFDISDTLKRMERMEQKA